MDLSLSKQDVQIVQSPDSASKPTESIKSKLPSIKNVGISLSAITTGTLALVLAHSYFKNPADSTDANEIREEPSLTLPPVVDVPAAPITAYKAGIITAVTMLGVFVLGLVVTGAGYAISSVRKPSLSETQSNGIVYSIHQPFSSEAGSSSSSSSTVTTTSIPQRTRLDYCWTVYRMARKGKKYRGIVRSDIPSGIALGMVFSQIGWSIKENDPAKPLDYEKPLRVQGYGAGPKYPLALAIGVMNLE